MSKTRKTKKQKLRTTERVSRDGFVIKDEWLKSETKSKAIERVAFSTNDKKYFRQDLTKTIMLTMLVLALEIAIWQFITR